MGLKLFINFHCVIFSKTLLPGVFVIQLILYLFHLDIRYTHTVFFYCFLVAMTVKLSFIVKFVTKFQLKQKNSVNFAYNYSLVPFWHGPEHSDCYIFHAQTMNILRKINFIKHSTGEIIETIKKCLTSLAGECLWTWNFAPRHRNRVHEL